VLVAPIDVEESEEQAGTDSTTGLRDKRAGEVPGPEPAWHRFAAEAGRMVRNFTRLAPHASRQSDIAV
jgi:hypothetical protein